jgi:ankyrin repeat protein
MIKLLLESGADINTKSKDGWTAISRAAGRGNIETIKILIQAGADINVKDKNDGTPLGSAIVNRQLESVRVLLDAGVKINKSEIDFLFKFLDPNDNVMTNIKNLVLKL